VAVTIIGLVIVVVCAIYVALPLLSSAEGEPITEVFEASALQKEKDAALEAIREIDFDLRVGKLSEEDHAALRADLEKRALSAMSALDKNAAAEPDLRAVRGQGEGSGGDGAAGFCPACGHQFKRSASFCVSCGKKLPSSGGRGRRRANS